MNICFLLGGFFQSGGIGRVVSLIANGLSEDPSYRVTALCYYDTGKPNIYTLSDKVRQEFLLQKKKNMTRFLLEGGERTLRNFLKDHCVEVLVACGALFYPLSVRACKGIPTKVICWEHSDPRGNNDHRGQQMARRYGIKRSDQNIVLTKRALEVFVNEYHAQNTIQIYNPIDSEIYKHQSKNATNSKSIISVGRLTYQKNFEAAVEVARMVLPFYPEWTWDVYGQGEDLDRLMRLVKEHGIDHQMHFLGQVTDLYKRYNQYSIMVMTSRYEGFPMSLLEGIGNGLPIVAFDVPTGPDEIIENNENGYLIEFGNTSDMGSKIKLLIDDEGLRTRMSESARSRCEMFSKDGIIKLWKENFEVLIQ